MDGIDPLNSDAATNPLAGLLLPHDRPQTSPPASSPFSEALRTGQRAEQRSTRSAPAAVSTTNRAAPTSGHSPTVPPKSLAFPNTGIVTPPPAHPGATNSAPPPASSSSPDIAATSSTGNPVAPTLVDWLVTSIDASGASETAAELSSEELELDAVGGSAEQRVWLSGTWLPAMTAPVPVAVSGRAPVPVPAVNTSLLPVDGLPGDASPAATVEQTSPGESLSTTSFGELSSAGQMLAGTATSGELSSNPTGSSDSAAPSSPFTLPEEAGSTAALTAAATQFASQVGGPQGLNQQPDTRRTASATKTEATSTAATNSDLTQAGGTSAVTSASRGEPLPPGVTLPENETFAETSNDAPAKKTATAQSPFAAAAAGLPMAALQAAGLQSAVGRVGIPAPVTPSAGIGDGRESNSGLADSTTNFLPTAVQPAENSEQPGSDRATNEFSAGLRQVTESGRPTLSASERLNAPVIGTEPAVISPWDRQQLLDELGHAVVRAQDQRDSLTVRIAPPDLGTIVIHVESSAAGLEVRFDPSSPETQQLLAEHLPLLQESLTQLGRSVDRLEITRHDAAGLGQTGTGHQQGQFQQAGEQPRERVWVPPHATDAPLPPGVPHPAVTVGNGPQRMQELNIRV